MVTYDFTKNNLLIFNWQSILVNSQKYHSEPNVRYFYGPKEAVTWLCRNHGMRKTFYRGFTALMLRDSNSFGVYVMIYEVVKDLVISQLG